MAIEGDAELQESVCSSLAEMVDCAQDKAKSFSEPIVMMFLEVCGSCRGKCLLALLDMISLLVCVCSDQFQNEEAIGMIMNPLIGKWNEIPENDKILAPLLRSLLEITKAVKIWMEPYIHIIIQRCLKIILGVYDCLINDENKQEYDVEFAVQSLLLLTETFKSWSDGKSFSHQFL
jgi:transportin-1